MLYSTLNPEFFFETSFAIIKSQYLFFNFNFEFSNTFSVSAEKPITICGLFLLFFPRNSKMSEFFSSDIVFNSSESFFNLYLLIFFGLKSATAAAQTAISTGKVFLLHPSFLWQWLPFLH
mgnify:CR=1 FL=1